MKTRSTTLGLIAAAATAVVLVAGCSGASDDAVHPTGSMPTSSMPTAPADHNAADHNAADVMWTQMMIPHHRQAVEMAALAPSRTENAELLALAAQVQAAQDPEIAQMTAWLAAWGVPAMPGGMDHSMPGGTSLDDMGHDDMGHDGMMTAEQMTQLENATRAEFDRAWLELMIAHHRGAIDSFRQIQVSGRSPQVEELAGAIITGQQAEIEQMTSMLGR